MTGKGTHGSPEADVHLMVIEPPEVGFSGISRVSAVTKGATKARRLVVEKTLELAL